MIWWRKKPDLRVLDDITELYVGEEDVTHADLQIMRNQFLEQIAERGLSEQGYLDLVQAKFELEASLAVTVAGLERIDPRIEMPPGKRMLEIGALLFSDRSVELVIQPIVADYRHEFFAALAAGAPPKKLAVIHARHRAGFVIAVLELIVPFVGRIMRLFKG